MVYSSSVSGSAEPVRIPHRLCSRSRTWKYRPRELRPGTKATVAVTVNNNGHHAGTFKVTLKIDGVTIGAKDITLARNMSDRVEFSIPATSPGAFAVNVADLSGTLTVLEA